MAEPEFDLRVTWGTLAEYVSHTLNGRLNVLAAFDEIRAPSFPHSAPPVSYVFRLVAGESPPRVYKFQLTVVGPDGEAIFSTSSTVEHPEIAHGVTYHVDHVARVSRWTFTGEGTYRVQLTVDGVPLYASDLTVLGTDEE